MQCLCRVWVGYEIATMCLVVVRIKFKQLLDTHTRLFRHPCHMGNGYTVEVHIIKLTLDAVNLSNLVNAKRMCRLYTRVTTKEGGQTRERERTCVCRFVSLTKNRIQRNFCPQLPYKANTYTCKPINIIYTSAHTNAYVYTFNYLKHPTVEWEVFCSAHFPCNRRRIANSVYLATKK